MKDAGGAVKKTFVLDTSGDGKRGEYVEPNQPVVEGKDKRINGSFYAVMPSPADGSIWGTFRGFPGAVVRVMDDKQLPHVLTALRLFADADVVVGAHGAGLTNIITSAPGTGVFEIVPRAFAGLHPSPPGTCPAPGG